MCAVSNSTSCLPECCSTPACCSGGANINGDTGAEDPIDIETVDDHGDITDADGVTAGDDSGLTNGDVGRDEADGDSANGGTTLHFSSSQMQLLVIIFILKTVF